MADSLREAAERWHRQFVSGDDIFSLAEFAVEIIDSRMAAGGSESEASPPSPYKPTPAASCSLREAATAAVSRYDHFGDGTGTMAGAINELEDALSAPDPVAEAREIIAELVGFAEEYGIKNGLKARDWLKRNGG